MITGHRDMKYPLLKLTPNVRSPWVSIYSSDTRRGASVAHSIVLLMTIPRLMPTRLWWFERIGPVRPQISWPSWVCYRPRAVFALISSVTLFIAKHAARLHCWQITVKWVLLNWLYCLFPRPTCYFFFISLNIASAFLYIYCVYMCNYSLKHR